MQTVLNVLLKQMIPLAVVVTDLECTGDEPLHYFTLLLELLQTVDLDSTFADAVIRFVDL